MSGVRVSEPYMRFLIVKWWKELFGVLMDERDINDKQVYANDSLATFLTSSLNVELVHVILEAITKFTTSYEDPSITHKDFLKQNDDKRFTELNKFTIDTIVIQNPEKWKVAKLAEFVEAAQDFGIGQHKTTIKRKIQKSTFVASGIMAGNRNENSESKDVGGVPLIEEEDEDVLVINEDVKVIEYSPKVFQFLRCSDGIK